MEATKFRYWDGEYGKMCWVRAIVWVNGVIGNIELDDRETIIRHPNMFFDHALLQYTGLKDKHGREIYEGDVVDILGKQSRVDWEQRYCGFICHGIPSNFPMSLHIDLLKLGIQVIGNIYENPELIHG
jgi:uncharacterized phage protein (TIGR01671 family)